MSTTVDTNGYGTILTGRSPHQVAAASKWLAPVETEGKAKLVWRQPYSASLLIGQIDRLLEAEPALQGKSGHRVALQSIRRALAPKAGLGYVSGDEPTEADETEPDSRSVPEVELQAVEAELAAEAEPAKPTRKAPAKATKKATTKKAPAPVLDVEPQWTTIGRTDVGDLVWYPGSRTGGRNEAREVVVSKLRKVTRIEGARHFPTLKLVGGTEVSGGRATKLWVVKAAVANAARKGQASTPAAPAARPAVKAEPTARKRGHDPALSFAMADHPSDFVCRQCNAEQPVSAFPTCPAGIGVKRTRRQTICRQCRDANNGHTTDAPAPKPTKLPKAEAAARQAMLGMTLTQLRKAARALDIKGAAKLSRDELLAAMHVH